MADGNAASRESKTGFKLQSIVSCVAILIAIVLVCVSVVLDPAQAANGFTARTQIVSQYTLPTFSDTSFLDELDKDIEDYTIEGLADIFASDEDKRRAAIRYKYASEVRVNEYGQTYGSGLAGDPYTGEGVPDLVLVTATNGNDGYIYSDTYRYYMKLIDTMPLDEVRSIPELCSIPVYDSDGRTQIGIYQLL